MFIARVLLFIASTLFLICLKTLLFVCFSWIDFRRSLVVSDEMCCVEIVNQIGFFRFEVDDLLVEDVDISLFQTKDAICVRVDNGGWQI